MTNKLSEVSSEEEMPISCKQLEKNHFQICTSD